MAELRTPISLVSAEGDGPTRRVDEVTGIRVALGDMGAREDMREDRVCPELNGCVGRSGKGRAAFGGDGKASPSISSA